MLVLKREVQQQIKIGDSITITVVEIEGKAVKLGIEAPRDVPVHRREVFDEISAERKPAA